MKKILLLSPLLLLMSCYNVERNCADFKTGKFKFEYEIDGVKKTTVFERNDSIEIETYEGKTDTSTIRWVNDCEYILQKKHPKMKAIFFTNSRANRIVKLLSEEDIHKYVIIGFDMIEPNIKLLEDNKLDFIINQNPIQQGYMGVINFVHHFILKKQIKKAQYLPLDIVLKENMDFYLKSFEYRVI